MLALTMIAALVGATAALGFPLRRALGHALARPVPGVPRFTWPTSHLREREEEAAHAWLEVHDGSLVLRPALGRPLVLEADDIVEVTRRRGLTRVRRTLGAALDLRLPSPRHDRLVRWFRTRGRVEMLEVYVQRAVRLEGGVLLLRSGEHPWVFVRGLPQVGRAMRLERTIEGRNLVWWGGSGPGVSVETPPLDQGSTEGVTRGLPDVAVLDDDLDGRPLLERVGLAHGYRC